MQVVSSRAGASVALVEIFVAHSPDSCLTGAGVENARTRSRLLAIDQAVDRAADLVPSGTSTAHARLPGRNTRRFLTLGLLMMASAVGCKTPDGPLARWRTINDHVLAPSPTVEESGDTRGPISRLLLPEFNPAKSSSDPNVAKASTASEESKIDFQKHNDEDTEREFDAAQTLYEAGNFTEAEKAFARIEKRQNSDAVVQMYGPNMKSGVSMNEQTPLNKTGTNNNWVRDAGKNLTSPFRNKKAHTVWGEKSLFYLAESQYQQGKLVNANDSYVKLMVNYPGTRFRDEVVKREYDIAVTWLDAVDPIAPPEKRGSFTDHFNGKLPFVDVSGTALQVMEHVRHHDPDANAPYGDDAVKRIADYHYQYGHWDEASTTYDQLIADHPKSEYLQYAYSRAIDSKLKAYYGPDYDSGGLDKANQQIEQMGRLFPERNAETRETLAQSSDLINDQNAEITFRRGEFYEQTGYPGAAEFCFGEVKARWPSSDWGKKASSKLDLIAKAPRKKVEPSRIMTLPGASDPYANGMTQGSAANGGGGGMGGP